MQRFKANPEWRSRLSKAHTHAKSFPTEYREGAAELDSSMSSDALLMNCFCYPGFVNAKVATLLGVTPGAVPKFGEKARIKLSDGSVDRTELDMQLGKVNVEAKLTEGDFTEKAKAKVKQYADFAKTFETNLLSSVGDSYLHYQLIRNVLAVAPFEEQHFVLVLDARRPDLLRGWWNVHTAIKDASLRARCRFVFWQELAEAAQPKLRNFLKEKYALCD